MLFFPSKFSLFFVNVNVSRPLNCNRANLECIRSRIVWTNIEQSRYRRYIVAQFHTFISFRCVCLVLKVQSVVIRLIVQCSAHTHATIRGEAMNVTVVSDTQMSVASFCTQSRPMSHRLFETWTCLFFMLWRLRVRSVLIVWSSIDLLSWRVFFFFQTANEGFQQTTIGAVCMVRPLFSNHSFNVHWWQRSGSH